MTSAQSVQMVTDTQNFLHAYLFSYLYWADLSIGALPLLMISHLTGGNWGAVTRRILEALCDTLFLVAIFSLPILIWVKEIYPWMIPKVALEPNILHKQS